MDKQSDRIISLFKVLVNEPKASENVKEVLASGFTGEGNECTQFENEFQQLVEAPIKPLLMNSCTSALDLTYHLLNLNGKSVISSSLTCLATNMPLLHRNVNIIWADVDETGNIDPVDVARKMNKDVGAIICIDWTGRPCRYDELKSFGVPLVHDAAHSALTRYKGESIAKTGGDYICWSHQSIKTLSMGDGGSLLVPNEEIRKEARLLRWYYLDRESNADFRCQQNTKVAGYKMQSNNILASIGLANMELTKWAVDRHRSNALKLWSELKDIDGISVPEYTKDSSYWIFGILIDKMDRDFFTQKMQENGVCVSQTHRRNDHHDSFKQFRTNLPNLNIFSEKQVNLPCGWWLNDNDLDRIINSVKMILK